MRNGYFYVSRKGQFLESWGSQGHNVSRMKELLQGSRPWAGPHFTEATAQPLRYGQEAACWKKVTYLQSTFVAFHVLTFKKEILNWRGDWRGSFYESVA